MHWRLLAADSYYLPGAAGWQTHQFGWLEIEGNTQPAEARNPAFLKRHLVYLTYCHHSWSPCLWLWQAISLFVLYPGLATAVMLATCMITQDRTNKRNLISPQEIITELLCLKSGTMLHFASEAHNQKQRHVSKANFSWSILILSWKRPSYQQSFCVGSEIFQPASHISWTSITTHTHTQTDTHKHTHRHWVDLLIVW